MELRQFPRHTVYTALAVLILLLASPCAALAQDPCDPFAPVPPIPVSVSLNQAEVIGRGQVSGTVAVTDFCGRGGRIILTANPSAFVSFGGGTALEVIIAPGSSSGDFAFPVVKFNSQATVTVVLTASSLQNARNPVPVSVRTAFTISPLVPSISLDQNQVTVGTRQTVLAFVTVNDAEVVPVRIETSDLGTVSPLGSDTGVFLTDPSGTATITLDVSRVLETTPVTIRAVALNSEFDLNGQSASAVLTVCPPQGCQEPKLKIGAVIGAEPIAPQTEASTTPVEAHFPLGSFFRIGLFDDQGQPVNSSFSLGAASLEPGVDPQTLFPNHVAIQYASPASNEASFQGVHRGNVLLTITPVVSNLNPVQVRILIENPAALGTTHNEVDELIYPFGHSRGIPPQYIKGQIQRESDFDPRSWRYEPIASDGDLGKVSRGRTPPLREVLPFSLYRLATAQDDGGLSQGVELRSDDLAPRGEGRFPLRFKDPNTGQIRPLQAGDPNPTARELYQVNDRIQHWSEYGAPDVVKAVDQNPLLLDFVGQTPLASSYGLLHTLYVTVIRDMQWVGTSAGAKNPSFLFDTPENRQIGGGTLGLGTLYFATKYPEVNPDISHQSPILENADQFRITFVRGMNRYNHRRRPKDEAEYSTDSYGVQVLGFSDAYVPLATGPIFR